MGSERLKEALRRLKGPGRAKVNLGPDTPFDAVLEERIRSVERMVDELKIRVNGLLFLMVGAIIVQIVLKIVA